MKKNIKIIIICIILLFVILITSICFLNSNKIEVVFQKKEGKISIGDEYAIGSENFYVAGVNDKEVVLLAKYNLYVGDNFEVEQTGDWKYHHREKISMDSPLYGLQNPNARGGVLNDEVFYGVVPFSAKRYWYNSNKKQLVVKYGETEKKKNWTKNNIYDEKYMDKPIINYSNGYGETEENNYSIAYYTEPYLEKLRQLGAPRTTKIRLLLADEAIKLGCFEDRYICNNDSTPEWVYSTTYWLGSIQSESRVWFIGSDGSFLRGHYERTGTVGLRPVIIINKKDIISKHSNR